MLFYKRVEPEEETSKEVKFDVSSELLEVYISELEMLYHRVQAT